MALDLGQQAVGFFAVRCVEISEDLGRETVRDSDRFGSIQLRRAH